MPLSGIRIVDLTRILAGPFCAMILAAGLRVGCSRTEPAGTGRQPGGRLAGANPLDPDDRRGRHPAFAAGAHLPPTRRYPGARRGDGTRHVPQQSERGAGHCEAEAPRWFLDRGFIVVSALRRGYGATGGDWAEGIAHKPGDGYFRPGLETARDIAATVDYATAPPFAQSRAAVVIGHSGGGWGAIAYDSIPHPRVTALISMAGGRGQTMTADGVWRSDLGVSRPDLLIDAAGQFGRAATTPMLWVYSENDKFLSPALAASLYDAFTRSGGKAELVQVGPYGNDGHRFFFSAGGSQLWGPPVARYLAQQPAQ